MSQNLKFIKTTDLPSSGTVGAIYCIAGSSNNKNGIYVCTDTSTFIQFSDMDNATASVAGLMSAADKTKLDKYTTVGSSNTGIYIDSNGTPTVMGYSVNKTVPSDAKFTDTDTKVTAVGNHYTPSGGTSTTPSSSGTAARGSTIVMTGITKDAAGHVTGVTGYTLPASDNTDTKVTAVGNHYTPTGTTTKTASASGTAGSTVSAISSITMDAAGHVTAIGSVAATDTRNTAGSTDTSSKIFLVGATSQAANPQTYSDNEIYVTSGVLTTKSVQVGGGSANIVYDSTNECIKFTF